MSIGFQLWQSQQLKYCWKFYLKWQKNREWTRHLKPRPLHQSKNADNLDQKDRQKTLLRSIHKLMF